MTLDTCGVYCSQIQLAKRRPLGWQVNYLLGSCVGVWVVSEEWEWKWAVQS